MGGIDISDEIIKKMIEYGLNPFGFKKIEEVEAEHKDGGSSGFKSKDDLRVVAKSLAKTREIEVLYRLVNSLHDTLAVTVQVLEEKDETVAQKSEALRSTSKALDAALAACAAERRFSEEKEREIKEKDEAIRTLNEVLDMTVLNLEEKTDVIVAKINEIKKKDAIIDVILKIVDSIKDRPTRADLLRAIAGISSVLHDK
jgi:hypothetical protein